MTSLELWNSLTMLNVSENWVISHMRDMSYETHTSEEWVNSHIPHWQGWMSMMNVSEECDIQEWVTSYHIFGRYIRETTHGGHASSWLIPHWCVRWLIPHCCVSRSSRPSHCCMYVSYGTELETHNSEETHTTQQWCVSRCVTVVCRHTHDVCVELTTWRGSRGQTVVTTWRGSRDFPPTHSSLIRILTTWRGSRDKLLSHEWGMSRRDVSYGTHISEDHQWGVTDVCLELNEFSAGAYGY